jgi:hypothetical protein
MMLLVKIDILCMVRIMWGEDQVPIYLCAWYVLNIWRLHLMEK